MIFYSKARERLVALERAFFAICKQNIENENISREIHENSLIFQIFLSVLIVSPSSGGRRAKTLTGSFPFGAQQHHGHHGHHGEHHEHHGERHETQFDFGETLFLEGTYTATL